jgi:hypothetical protein
MQDLCVKCQGKGLCGRPCPILKKFSSFKFKSHFSGSSPPEIFVGKYGYPNVNTGILSPIEIGNTEHFGMPEIWHDKKFSIDQIIDLRSQMVYGRFKSKIKGSKNKFLGTMQEIALASKHVDAEVFLKKAPKSRMNLGSETPIIGNPAPLKNIRLESNPKVESKVDYLVGDTDAKATSAMQEMYKGKIEVSNIIKVLSAGLLGLGINRKLVPTRWAITATDDTISKVLLNKARLFPEISEFVLFHAEYLGNHYEFLLLPDKFSFEVLEAKMPGSVWNPNQDSELYVAQDYEGFFGRKTYASNVTGAYYANLLALVEYFMKVKRQASCLVMRECRPEYYAPCGVGILREASRQAFKNKSEKFPTLKQALQAAQTRLRLPISVFQDKSWLLKEFGKQTRLNRFF